MNRCEYRSAGEPLELPSPPSIKYSPLLLFVALLQRLDVPAAGFASTVLSLAVPLLHARSWVSEQLFRITKLVLHVNYR